MKIIVLFFISLLFCFSSVAQNVTVLGTYSCGFYVKSRELGSTSPPSWVLGFLSGANVYKPQRVDLLKSVDHDSLFLWMDKYCKENPLEFIEDGAKLLLNELQKKPVDSNKK